MFFDTPVYIVFLTVVVVLYWRLTRRGQNIFLLAASYFFYGWWDYRFLALILISTFVDFNCARFIGRSTDTKWRKSLLVLSLLVNLSFLGFFKYFNFFIDSLITVLGTLGIHDVHVTTLRILLPPGISFYTFQAVAYIVERLPREDETFRFVCRLRALHWPFPASDCRSNTAAIPSPAPGAEVSDFGLQQVFRWFDPDYYRPFS